MKQYLVKLPNGYYFMASSAIDFLVGDKYNNGTIVQVGIQMQRYGMHFNISIVETSSN